jgi:glutamate/tyrosine decarboxylase-like PLP-dependent enzyme
MTALRGAFLTASQAAERARDHEGGRANDWIAAAQAHSCVLKACMVAGVQNARMLPARAEHGWALQPEALAAAIQADRRKVRMP